MVDTINYSASHASGVTLEGNLVEDNLFDNFDVRRKVVIASGAGSLKRATALGKVTASGKWVVSTAAATDGSQVIRAILLHDADATSADVEAIVGRRGRCNSAAVILGAGHTLASVDDACIDRGIIFDKVFG